MSYLSKTTFKNDWLRLELDTSMDAMIDRFLTTAEKEIAGILNQPIEQQATTVLFFGNDRAEHPLWYTVPVALTSLSYRDNVLDAWTAATSGDYALVSRQYGASVYYADGFYAMREYKVVANVGWASGSVPVDIQTAGYELAKELYMETPFAGQVERFGVNAVTEGQGGMSFSKSILRMRPLIATKLSHYLLTVI